MASGGGAEQHLPHHLQQHAGSVDVQSVVGVSGMGDSPGEGEGQAGDLVVGGHQPPASEGKGIKKAKREVVGGEEKKKENPTDWSECAVNYLLEVYEEKYVSLSRGNLRSNDWEDVARYVNFKCEGSRSAKTAEQCKWKMENLKRRYKVEKQRQAATGAVSSLWPFFPRMDEMLISSFKFVATSPENGSGDAEDHPANVSVVSFSPQRVNRGAHAKAEVGFKKESDVYGSCAVGSVTIKELQKRMADFARERDWDQFHSPRNLLLALVGEVGELSEIFQWKGEVPRGLPGWNVSEKEHLGEELSDVLLYLVRLADICEVDLGQAALRKIKKNAKKYPVELCKGTARKYTPCENPNGDDVALDKI
ncbi:dCTP diphosphatase [Marchantia polymorpha subsp. ruderalis]|uniref:Myb/SANT-like DNA-binding domain-containing protein n=2 Tax=Marchantia polymorpha TaxID=3197 RepID=A0AAF6AVH3_MARPO|nr:hypothetical protein MARPO_0107s0039 [Marchantia polymorpha]BBN00444.1 hypothetical protein Mp_1g29240 [Marchantia polymorpha subsp. ruderalis]|eukprot:PTQ31772.1 hypothetical protein MARPO_0107s0039 [Marchantia polymorpha]